VLRAREGAAAGVITTPLASPETGLGHGSPILEWIVLEWIIFDGIGAPHWLRCGGHRGGHAGAPVFRSHSFFSRDFIPNRYARGRARWRCIDAAS
jgi:hypothetical protein